MQVMTPTDDYQSLEHAAVDCDLARQPAERVAVALYFVAAQLAVDYRKVDSAFVLTQSQLFDNQRVRIARMTFVQLAEQDSANVAVA